MKASVSRTGRQPAARRTPPPPSTVGVEIRSFPSFRFATFRRFTVTKTNRLTAFKEIIAVYSEKHMKPVNTLCGQNEELMIVKGGGTHSYQWA
jgi:hypothetical protein